MAAARVTAGGGTGSGVKPAASLACGVAGGRGPGHRSKPPPPSAERLEAGGLEAGPRGQGGSGGRRALCGACSEMHRGCSPSACWTQKSVIRPVPDGRVPGAGRTNVRAGRTPLPAKAPGDTPASPGPAAAVREPLGVWQRHSGLGPASPRPALGPPRCARSRVPLNFLWRSPNTGTASGGGALGGDGG